ncbi:uncharacterized protein LOC144345988 [Saccoglossus kowalevskii]
MVRSLSTLVLLLAVCCLFNVIILLYSNNQCNGGTPMGHVGLGDANANHQWQMPDKLQVHGFPTLVDTKKQHVDSNLDDSYVKGWSEFQINAPNACSSKKHIQLLVVVSSNINDSRSRKVSRETWMNALRTKSSSVVIIFAVGGSNNGEEEAAIKSENHHNGDIVHIRLGNKYQDSLKMISIIKWAAEFCPNARFLLKISDNVMIVNDNILNYLEQKESTWVAEGNVETMKESDRDIRRNNHSPGSVDSDYLHSYLQTPVYLLSMDVVEKLYATSLSEQPIQLEHLFLENLLKKIGIVSINHPGFTQRESALTYDKQGNTICRNRNKFIWPVKDAFHMAQLGKDLESMKCEQYYKKHVENAPESKHPVQLKILNEFSYDFEVTHATLCEDQMEPIFLLLLTISDAESELHRHAIRNTWGADLNLDPEKTILRLFVVGLSEDNRVNERLLDESAVYGDIIIPKIQQTSVYKSLVLMMSFKWVIQFCPMVEYVMKTDDHAFLNMQNIMWYLYTAPSSRLVVGDILGNKRPIREPTSQWYVSETLYSSTSYPYYPSGLAFIMSGDMVNRTYNSAKHTQLFVFEDVYIGLILHKISFVPTSHPGFDTVGSQHSTCDLVHLMVTRCSRVDVPFFMYKYLRDLGWSEFENCTLDNTKFSHIKYVSHFNENQEVGDVFHPHSYNFLINHPNICTGQNAKPFLLIGVLTSPQNFSTRTAIRDTWGKFYDKQNNNPWRTVVLFLLGLPINNIDLQLAIHEENNRYNDILQQGFFESYDHLVLKSLMLVRYVAEHCPQAVYVLKIDDDVFLHTDNMVTFLAGAPKHNFYSGDPLVGTPPIRNVYSKWYTPNNIWPLDTYPPYCTGPSYVMSGDLVKKVYNASMNTRPFRWEDLYIGNLISNMGVAPYPHIHFDMSGIYRDRCSLHKSLVSHHKLSKDFYKYAVQLSMSKHNISESCGSQPDTYLNNVPGFTLQGRRWNAAVQQSCNSAYLLIVVYSHPFNTHERKLQRLSWASSGIVLDVKVVVLFLVQNHEDGIIQKYLENEKTMFGDMILFDSTETAYVNKTGLLQSLIWTNLNCQEFTYVMYVDDTVFVNIANILTFVKQQDSPDLAAGELKSVMRENSDSPIQHIPLYLDRRGMIMSKSISNILYTMSGVIGPLSLDDDVYLGLLARKASVSFLNNSGFIFDEVQSRTRKLVIVSCYATSVMVTDMVPWSDIIVNKMNGRFDKLKCNSKEGEGLRSLIEYTDD